MSQWCDRVRKMDVFQLLFGTSAAVVGGINIAWPWLDGRIDILFVMGVILCFIGATVLGYEWQYVLSQETKAQERSAYDA